jgi:hypothetical protein
VHVSNDLVTRLINIHEVHSIYNLQHMLSYDELAHLVIFKVIPQFCIAHFYCAHLITYNFIHETYRLKKISFYDNFMLLQNSLVTFVQRITLKSMFSKKACKSVARVPVSVVYLFTCISRFNATIP